MNRLIIIVFSALGIGYLAICAAACGFQRALIFPASPLVREPKRIKVVHVEGGTPMLWHPPEEGKPVVVHFHGNGEQIADVEWLTESFAARGLGFAAIEYPGYGLAKGAGQPSEESIAVAAKLALEHLRKLGISNERLVLQGQSIGTGVAVRLASEGWGVRLILISPYTTLPDVGARALPYLPVRLLMTERFDSASRAASVTIPVLLIHGDQDEVVPFDLGESLASMFPDARFVRVSGGHHNDILLQSGVWPTLLKFAAQ